MKKLLTIWGHAGRTTNSYIPLSCSSNLKRPASAMLRRYCHSLSIKPRCEDNKNSHSALPNLEMRLIPLVTSLSPTSAGNAAPPTPTVILLDWRQYGVDGWIQFALAVDPLIWLVARSGSWSFGAPGAPVLYPIRRRRLRGRINEVSKHGIKPIGGALQWLGV